MIILEWKRDTDQSITPSASLYSNICCLISQLQLFFLIFDVHFSDPVLIELHLPLILLVFLLILSLDNVLPLLYESPLSHLLVHLLPQQLPEVLTPECLP